MVTGDETAVDVFLTGKSWGVEKLSVAQRHYKALIAGVDQFGGNNEAAPILEAYQMGVKEFGEAFIRKRFEQSAIRVLKNVFQTGLFENPYLDAVVSKNMVGNAQFMSFGYQAQLKSIVMLKNKNNALPITEPGTVYIPKRFTPAGKNFLGFNIPEKTEYPVNLEIVKKYFKVTDNPDNADFALVVIASPNSGGGYDANDVKNGGNGYVPVSLQYGPYTAGTARETSIAGGDPLEKFTNRSYKNKTSEAINKFDLSMVTSTYSQMKGKPVVVSVNLNNPMVFSEIEKYANAIITDFGVQNQAIMDIVSGKAEPSGLLPLQMPADMLTVEKQFEDVPHDMICHTDSEGHLYDFGYGMNWKGVIKDARTAKYKVVKPVKAK